MKNVTISLEDDIHRQSRIRAAHHGMSMSKYLAALVERDLEQAPPDTAEAERQKRLEAVERFIAGPKFEIAVDGRMPTAEERNARD